jgi:hypothetical protein
VAETTGCDGQVVALKLFSLNSRAAAIFGRSFLAIASAALVTFWSLAFARGKPDSGRRTLAERLGYPAKSRLLIIHADDFGMFHSGNRAISEALEKHWITSASVMTPCPWFSEVVHWAKTHTDVDLGLHLTLNSDWTSYRWTSVSPQPRSSSLLDVDGYLPLTTQNVDVAAKSPEVEVEVRAQMEKAVAAGLHLTHIDNHMGTLTSTPDLTKLYLELGKRYALPVLLEKRDIGTWNTDLTVRIRTKYYGIQIPTESVVLDAVIQMMPGVPKSRWCDAYKKMLALLPPGTYELIVHLAYDDAEVQGATSDHPRWGSQWRQNDFDLIQSVEFHTFLKDQNFILISWKDLTKVTSR